MSSGKILVVDDEEDIRGLLQEILAEEGYDVEIAANAAEARLARGRGSHDLVLLDIWMPDVDGITLLREWTSTLFARRTGRHDVRTRYRRNRSRGDAPGRV